jgi:hypothetical protein
MAMDAERPGALLNFATFAEVLPCVMRGNEDFLGFACKKPTGKKSATIRVWRGKAFFKRMLKFVET